MVKVLGLMGGGLLDGGVMLLHHATLHVEDAWLDLVDLDWHLTEA